MVLVRASDSGAEGFRTPNPRIKLLRVNETVPFDLSSYLDLE